MFIYVDHVDLNRPWINFDVAKAAMFTVQNLVWTAMRTTKRVHEARRRGYRVSTSDSAEQGLT